MVTYASDFGNTELLKNELHCPNVARIAKPAPRFESPPLLLSSQVIWYTDWLVTEVSGDEQVTHIYAQRRKDATHSKPNTKIPDSSLCFVFDDG